MKRFKLIFLLFAAFIVFQPVVSCNPDEVIPGRIGPEPGQKQDPGSDPGQDPGGDPGQDPGEDPKPDPPAKEYAIPIIWIDTDGAAPIRDKDNYVNGTIKVSDPKGYFSDVKEFEARMKIKGRGNSTWGMPKKPYKIKLEEKAEILGIPKDKEWVLLANYADKSLLRNITAMEMSRILGFRWTPVMISVEFYLNGEYQGVYVFTEHKKVSKNRVNIDTENDSFYIEIENEDVD